MITPKSKTCCPRTLIDGSPRVLADKVPWFILVYISLSSVQTRCVFYAFTRYSRSTFPQTTAAELLLRRLSDRMLCCYGCSLSDDKNAVSTATRPLQVRSSVAGDTTNKTSHFLQQFHNDSSERHALCGCVLGERPFQCYISKFPFWQFAINKLCQVNNTSCYEYD